MHNTVNTNPNRGIDRPQKSLNEIRPHPGTVKSSIRRPGSFTRGAPADQGYRSFPRVRHFKDGRDYEPTKRRFEGARWDAPTDGGSLLPGWQALEGHR